MSWSVASCSIFHPHFPRYELQNGEGTNQLTQKLKQQTGLTADVSPTEKQIKIDWIRVHKGGCQVGRDRVSLARIYEADPNCQIIARNVSDEDARLVVATMGRVLAFLEVAL